MGLKSKLARWAIGQGVSDYLQKMGVEKLHRERVVKAVKSMLKLEASKKEPVLLGGAVTVAVALAGAFGLELTVEQLSITVSTIIAIVSFFIRRRVSPVIKEKE
jgi:hypothetical protein